MDETFRYLAIRDPKPLRATKSLAVVSVSPGAQSPFYKTMTAALGEGRSRGELKEIAAAYQAEHPDLFRNPYVGPAGQHLQTFVQNLIASDAAYDAEKLLNAADQGLKLGGYPGANVSEKLRSFFASDALVQTYARIADSMLSRSYAPARDGSSALELSAALKARHLLGLAADGSWPFQREMTFDALSTRIAIVLPPELMPARPAASDKTTQDISGKGIDRVPAQEKAPAEADKKTSVLKQALDEVQAQTRRRAFIMPKPMFQSVRMIRPDAERGWFSGIFGSTAAPAPEPQTGEANTAAPRRAVFSPQAYQSFSASTKALLKGSFGFSEDDTDPVQAAAAIESEIGRVHRESQVAAPRSYLAQAGNMLIAVNPKINVHVPMSPELVGNTLARECVHYSGIGELRIVKQELIAYELKDIAHIENVLKGESKERAHRRLDRTEQIVRELEDVLTENVQESASTERHELETESQKEAEQEVHVDGSLTVSGSYGPTVDFSATVSGGFSSTTTESSRRASKFAREVTEKAVKRIKENIVKEKRRTTLLEIEETNKHGIINTQEGAGHVRGVYRWLDKIYRARVYTYGLRHMLEFVVPEPAAFYLSSLAGSAKTIERLLEKPDFAWSTIDRLTWADKASSYDAQGVKAPPPRYQWIAQKFDVAAQQRTYHTHTDNIAIPLGYKANGAVVNLGNTSARDGEAGTFLTVHDQSLWLGDGDTATWVDFAREHAGGSISVTYRDWNFFSYALGIDVLCEITPEYEDQWRFDTFNAIMEAYNSYEAAYQARLDALAITEGVKIEGSNPEDNLRTIRRELQRCCLSTITENHLDQFNAFTDEWRADFAAARAQGGLVRFLQHAFEWENMTYVFYPYFWGRYEKWAQVVHTFGSPDPALSQFLQAGAARVQVPVRPGFEFAVARYCQDKTLPQDADTPVIGDDLYVPIIDEILESLDAPDGGVPVGDPWEVSVPTSLVLLEDAGNLKGFRDRVFGNANHVSNVYP